jgi:hypothetical protein
MSKSSQLLHIGCAVWGYKDWIGDLFPPGSKTPISWRCTAGGLPLSKEIQRSRKQIYFTFRYYLDAA